MSAAAFALVDWGTTSFRAWACAADGTVLTERRAPDGLTAVTDGDFAGVLERHLAAMGVGAGVPAVLCGMVGSRTGWTEAAYLPVPTVLEGLANRATAVSCAGRPVHVLPGLAQHGEAPDVMRGEETQLLGVVAEGFDDGLVCMPGTHSKWVRLEGGTVSGFATFMTGELFQLLRSHSILKQAVETDARLQPDDPGFAEGLALGLGRPSEVTNALFALRAGWLLEGIPPARQSARLSGLLIGLEFAGAMARLGRPTRVALLASGPIASLYEAAFEAAGLRLDRRLDADLCVRHGLLSAARSLHPDRSSP
ncbi:2-dehydro-3-deoxygalactonokinase [Aureimonas flava]|uniref:2-dehydro-3-deoxygalactonokinase n=1 Tax=Aureimonas flava TaxID=2320271 RepID=A0A3A1WPL5_9HYPH|nr:2-dehydro-3-deoxygalactonokinase [Aureimonas flava]RIY03340.1 2-dehydro-3-deoxygalactonokinase [Aureimonas flava]